MKNNSLILASSSPRRVELLAQIGITPTDICPADIDETPQENEKPRLLVERLARAKAEKAGESPKTTGHYILAADTVVALGTRILGKPKDEAEARGFLKLISGRRHRVIGGICLLSPTGGIHTRTVQTIVKIKALTEQDIDTYIASEEWRGKAGGYGIQGSFAMFVKDINGSYSNIVGLCLYHTRQLLTGTGF